MHSELFGSLLKNSLITYKYGFSLRVFSCGHEFHRFNVCFEWQFLTFLLVVHVSFQSSRTDLVLLTIETVLACKHV